MGEIESMEKEIELLRRSLNSLIEKSNYNKNFSAEILFLSQRLDEYIVQYTIKKLKVNNETY